MVGNLTIRMVGMVGKIFPMSECFWGGTLRVVPCLPVCPSPNLSLRERDKIAMAFSFGIAKFIWQFPHLIVLWLRRRYFRSEIKMNKFILYFSHLIVPLQLEWK